LELSGKAAVRWGLHAAGAAIVLALCDQPLAAQELLPANPFESSPQTTAEAAAVWQDGPWGADAAQASGVSPLAAWGRWRVRAGALLLNRTKPEGEDLSGLFLAGYQANAADFNFPLSGAVDVALRQPGQWADLDFRYFGVSQATAMIGPFTGELVDIGVPGFVPDVAEASLMSGLQSAELNLRRAVWPNVALLAGFRYVQFRETLESSEDLGPGLVLAGTEIKAANELFGFQIGTEALIFEYHRLRFEGAAKAGIFGNAASTSAEAFADVDPFAISVGADASRGSVAFVGDVNLTATYQLGQHFAVRGGYQLLWLSGVATATEQVPQLDVSPDQFHTTTGGSGFFHGAMVGLEAGW
jgi:hypothetical protein